LATNGGRAHPHRSGNFHSDRGDREEALKLFKEALQLQREVGNQTYESAALNNIGKLYLDRGDYDEAQTYFERALTLREKMNAPSDLADTLHNLAEVGLKLGTYDLALDRYVKALGIRRKAEDKLTHCDRPLGPKHSVFPPGPVRPAGDSGRGLPR
jgi:tetratricopeptide (TPR) repeat protein